jgi:hypothetical protein
LNIGRPTLTGRLFCFCLLAPRPTRVNAISPERLQSKWPRAANSSQPNRMFVSVARWQHAYQNACQSLPYNKQYRGIFALGAMSLRHYIHSQYCSGLDGKSGHANAIGATSRRVHARYQPHRARFPDSFRRFDPCRITRKRRMQTTLNASGQQRKNAAADGILFTAVKHTNKSTMYIATSSFKRHAVDLS